MSQNPQSGQPEPINIQKYLQSSRYILKRVREFDYKKFFQDIITFLSIIIAYFFVSLTYQFPSIFQKVIKINLKSADTIPLLTFIFSLYLIFWNIVGYTLKRRAQRPPPKKDEYDQIPIEQPVKQFKLPQLPNGEKYTHQLILESLNKTVYLFLLLISIGAYAYLNQPNRQNLAKLVDYQRVNYIGIWFIGSNLFYLIGSLVQKATKMSQWKVFGQALAYIIGFLALGLANGYNTFIFI